MKATWSEYNNAAVLAARLSSNIRNERDAERARAAHAEAARLATEIGDAVMAAFHAKRAESTGR